MWQDLRRVGDVEGYQVSHLRELCVGNLSEELAYVLPSVACKD